MEARAGRGRYFDQETMTYRWEESGKVELTYEQLEEFELASLGRMEEHAKENKLLEDI